MSTMCYCQVCGKEISAQAASCPSCGHPNALAAPKGDKSKLVAGLLAFFLGGFGFHKFYLGKTGLGILYLLFFWTLIPAFVAFFEAIIFFVTSDENFARKYG